MCPIDKSTDYSHNRYSYCSNRAKLTLVLLLLAIDLRVSFAHYLNFIATATQLGVPLVEA